MAVQEVVLKTNPCGPVPYSEKAVQAVLDDSYVIATTKKDGVQLNLVVTVAHAMALVEFLSRAGKTLPALQMAYAESHTRLLPTLGDDDCIYPGGYMVQAEIVMPGQPAEVLAGALRRKEPIDLSSIEVHVIAVVPMDVIVSGSDHNVTHAVMKYHVEATVALLKKHVPQIAWKAIEYIDVFSMDELTKVYEARRAAGEEGLVLEDPNAIWKRGKKVGKWKMKPDATIDGKVIGLVWGTPGLANEGKVIGFEVLLEDGHVVNACGLTEAMKNEVTTAVGLDSAAYDGWAVEVSFMERFKDGSLRHPSFERWRGISEPGVKE